MRTLAMWFSGSAFGPVTGIAYNLSTPAKNATGTASADFSLNHPLIEQWSPPGACLQ